MSKLAFYRSFLQSKGFTPKVTDDYVQFTFEGGNYAMPADDRDPAFFQIVFPNFHAIISPELRVQALEAASMTNSAMKVAKVYMGRHDAVPERNIPAGEDMSVTVEMLLPDPEAFGAVFERGLRILQEARQAFEARLQMLSLLAALPDEMRRKLGFGGGAAAA